MDPVPLCAVLSEADTHIHVLHGGESDHDAVLRVAQYLGYEWGMGIVWANTASRLRDVGEGSDLLPLALLVVPVAVMATAPVDFDRVRRRVRATVVTVPVGLVAGEPYPPTARLTVVATRSCLDDDDAAAAIDVYRASYATVREALEGGSAATWRVSAPVAVEAVNLDGAPGPPGPQLVVNRRWWWNTQELMHAGASQ